MNNNINLTDSLVIDLNIEQGKTLNKSIQCLVQSGSTNGLFDFTPYTASTLTVKRKPNDFYTVLSFSTADNSIVLGDGEFTLSKTNAETSLKSGQFYYEMSLISTGGTFGFLRGKFFIIDESYGSIDSDCSTIYLKPEATVWTGTTNNYFIYTGSTGGGTPYYTGATPTNVTVGALNAGTNISGFTLSQVIEKMVVTYLSPAFSSFSITGQASLIEVGTALSGNKTFTWSTSNSGNIQANSIAIRNVNTNTLIGSGLANDGSELLSIGTITNTAPISQSWRAEAINTNSSAFQSSNFTVASIYPWFYGKSSTLPTINNSLVTGGTKVLGISTGTISVTYNAAAEYLWFAIPSTSTSKTVWYQSALNNGSIGGASNLFGDLSSVSVTTVNWSGISYKVYISNYQTTTSGAMELRNS